MRNSEQPTNGKAALKVNIHYDVANGEPETPKLTQSSKNGQSDSHQ